MDHTEATEKRLNELVARREDAAKMLAAIRRLAETGDPAYLWSSYSCPCEGLAAAVRFANTSQQCIDHEGELLAAAVEQRRCRGFLPRPASYVAGFQEPGSDRAIAASKHVGAQLIPTFEAHARECARELADYCANVLRGHREPETVDG